MKKELKIGLKIIIYLFLIHFLVSFFVVYRFINPETMMSDQAPEDFGLDYEEVSFYSTDGILLSGWYIESLREEAPTIIVLHGYPAERRNMLPEANYLSQKFNVLMFDFRALGESEGRFSTLGGKEVNDLHGAIDYLKEEKKVEEVSLWGFSMGAVTAIQVAPEREEVVAVVSDSSFSSMEKSVKELFPIPIFRRTVRPFFNFWTNILADVRLKDVSPEDAISNLEVPIFLTHNKEDPVVLFDNAERLKEAMPENPDSMTLFVDSDYHGAFDVSIRDILFDFLESN